MYCTVHMWNSGLPNATHRMNHCRHGSPPFDFLLVGRKTPPRRTAWSRPSSFHVLHALVPNTASSPRNNGAVLVTYSSSCRFTVGHQNVAWNGRKPNSQMKTERILYKIPSFLSSHLVVYGSVGTAGDFRRACCAQHSTAHHGMRVKRGKKIQHCRNKRSDSLR